jgi:hypothetical protein
VSGGLAGACATIGLNRWFYWQELRRKFYPEVSNLVAAYTIRLEQPDGRFWVGVVGQDPSAVDKKFVIHRTSFLSGIIPFTDLREARKLRKAIVKNMQQRNPDEAQPFKLNLKPEYDALEVCMKTLHKKLRI